jgi:negative regulator of sigma E activity
MLLVPQQFSSVFDIIALSSLAVWQGISTIFAFISSDDWDKITGPNGLVFVLICGLIVIWTKSVRDDSAKERRHKESLAAQHQSFDSLLVLNTKTSEDLKILTVAATKAQLESTMAIQSMDQNIIRLTNEISDADRGLQTQLTHLAEICS